MRQEDKSLDSLRFEHVNTHPRIAREGAQVSQLYYARQGIITPEMEYIAIRENQLADRIREKYKKEKNIRVSFTQDEIEKCFNGIPKHSLKEYIISIAKNIHDV